MAANDCWFFYASKTSTGGKIIFANRKEAGKQLAELLGDLKDSPRVIVVGLLRGGLATAAEVAKALRVPLYGLVCRKISPPGNPEYAIGALCEDVLYAENNLPPAAVDQAKAEIANYHKNLPELIVPQAKDKIVVVVDDGLATGRTVFAAARYFKKQGAKEIIIAAPVASVEAAHQAREMADRVELIDIPAEFWAVGQFYEKFDQVDFDAVRSILNQSGRLSDWPKES